MRGIRTFAVSAVALAPVGMAPAAYATIINGSVHNEEVQRRSSGTPEFAVGQAQPTTGFRVGYQSSFLPTVAKQGGINAVYYFQVPTPPPSQVLTAATFSVSELKASAGTLPAFNVDVYAVGYEPGNPFAVDNPSTSYGSAGVASTSVAQTLFYSGANQTGATGLGGKPITKVAEKLFTGADFTVANAAGSVARTTSALPGSALASYIQSIYESPTFTPGGYLALRLTPDQAPDDAVTGTLRYQFPYVPDTDPGAGTGPTYDATFGAVVLPQINLTYAPIPEPGTLTVIGVAALGIARRRRRHQAR
jgi:hypothetical protein